MKQYLKIALLLLTVILLSKEMSAQGYYGFYNINIRVNVKSVRLKGDTTLAVFGECSPKFYNSAFTGYYFMDVDNHGTEGTPLVYEDDTLRVSMMNREGNVTGWYYHEAGILHEFDVLKVLNTDSFQVRGEHDFLNELGYWRDTMDNITGQIYNEDTTKILLTDINKTQEYMYKVGKNMYNSGYLCETNHGGHHFVAAYFGDSALIMRTTSKGAIMWSKKFLPGKCNITSLLLSPDTSRLIIGGTLDSGTTPGQDGFIAYISTATGNLVSGNVIHTTNNERIEQLAVCRNGIIGTGTFDTVKSEMLGIKFDRDLAIKWSKKYTGVDVLGIKSNAYGAAVCPYPDSSFAFVGTSETWTGHQDLFVVKTDTTVNAGCHLRWYQPYQTSLTSIPTYTTLAKNRISRDSIFNTAAKLKSYDNPYPAFTDGDCIRMASSTNDLSSHGGGRVVPISSCACEGRNKPVKPLTNH